MRRRFVQDHLTGEIREVTPRLSSPVHRDTFGKDEIPHMVEVCDRNRAERAKVNAKERKKALIEAYHATATH